MRLFSYWRSSSAWRVRIALALKGVACEIVPVHLLRDGGQQNAAAYLAHNPLGQVPVLEIDTETEDDDAGSGAGGAAGGRGGAGVWYLAQSMAILEYLEETFPKPPLLPPDAVSRARVRQLAEMVNSGIQPLQNLRLQQALRAATIDPTPLVRNFIAAGLHALERAGQSTAGRFLFGDNATFADVYLVPQLYSARRVAVDLTPYPTLLRVEAVCERLQAFQSAHPDAQPDREADPP